VRRSSTSGSGGDVRERWGSAWAWPRRAKREREGRGNTGAPAAGPRGELRIGARGGCVTEAGPLRPQRLSCCRRSLVRSFPPRRLSAARDDMIR
jgi:hypothetical protein